MTWVVDSQLLSSLGWMRKTFRTEAGNARHDLTSFIRGGGPHLCDTAIDRGPFTNSRNSAEGIRRLEEMQQGWARMDSVTLLRSESED